MKKNLFLLMFLFVGMLSQAQSGLSIGANIGQPVGDLENGSDLNFGFDFNALFPMSEYFQAGMMIGYTQFNGKDLTDFAFFEMEGDNLAFAPIGASARIGKEKGLFLRGDLGYGLSFTEGLDSGLYYRPSVGFNFGGTALSISYTAVSLDGITPASVNAGLEFYL